MEKRNKEIGNPRRLMMKLYLEMIKVEIKTSLQYKFSLMTELIGTLVGYVGNIIIYYIMFKNFKNLNGWNFHEMMFVYTFAGVAINLATVFFGHFINTDRDIINGNFDNYLLRPLDTFKYYLISKFNVVQVISLVFSTALFIYIVCNNPIQLTIFEVQFLIVCIIGAALINAGTFVLVGAAAFWTKKSAELYDSILWPAQYLSYLPIDIFPQLLRIVFTFVLPLAFVSFYPATLFLDLNASYEKYKIYGYLTAVVGIIFYFLCVKLWKYGIKKYESSGN